VPPEGVEAGAVNIVAAPLAVCAGFKEPQSVDPQVTLHITPEFVASLFTTALICVLAPGARFAGGIGANAIDIESVSMMSVILDTRLRLLTAVA
jgi:hypothetical protein